MCPGRSVARATIRCEDGPPSSHYGRAVSSTTIDGTAHGLDPGQRTVWIVASVSRGLVVGAALAALGFGTGVSWVTVAGVAVAVLGSLAGGIWSVMVWRSWRWSAWPDALELRHGVLYRKASLVPYHRIQQIDVTRGPIERALGLSCLVLRTASASSDGTLPGIPAERADELRRLLLVRAGLDDAV